jgi:ribose transport system substrate-binding protein
MKKAFCVFVFVLFFASVFTTCGSLVQAEAAEPIRIGVTFYDLANPVWAGGGQAIVEYARYHYGAEVILLGAENNAALQMTQMENLIEAGVDAIVVGAVDDNSLIDVVQRANDAGIKVIGFGTEPPGAIAFVMIVHNYEVGYTAGSWAANWINERLGGEAKVAVLRFDEMEVLIERGNGIEDALAKYAPRAEIVARASAADPVTGMNVTESILQEHPDIKVIVCIGDGGGIGANNAVKAAGLATDDFCIVSVDGVEEAAMAVRNNDPLRMTVGLGTFQQRAYYTVELVMNILNGRPFEERIYTPIGPVDASNVEQYIIDAGF